METSLPTPMTARVYVNLLEGLEMTVWTHWVHPAIFLTNEATSCHSHTIFMAKSTGNRKWCFSWRQSCPSRICSDQKCQKKTSTRFNKHQKASTNINKHQQKASWASCCFVVSIEHEQKTFPTSPDLGALEPWRIASAAASALEHEARSPVTRSDHSDLPFPWGIDSE